MGEGSIPPAVDATLTPVAAASGRSGSRGNEVLKTPALGSFRFSQSDVPNARWSEGIAFTAVEDAPEVLEQFRSLVLGLHYERALALAKEVLSTRDDEVRALVDLCSLRLSERFAARLGGLSAVPVLKVQEPEWSTLDLEPRTVLLLEKIDSVSTFEMIVDVSGMPRHEALGALSALMDHGIIEI
jgi:hypothetical protein